jgi:hypothetical protein
MKNKIYRLAREEFDYNPTTLLFEEEKIKQETEEGKSVTGFFLIRNAANLPMEGTLYTRSRFIRLKETGISGREARISYELSPLDKKAGELLSGRIILITSCGEYELLVELFVKEDEKKKKAGNLFRLANLARDDWEAAVVLYKNLYLREGKKGPISQEMEEFLIDGSKKSKVELRLEKNKYTYQKVEKSFIDEVVLKKNTWGYLKIDVWADADFIEPEHKVLWSDNFIEEEYRLSFFIDKELLHDGKNYGRLYIKTVHQLLVVEICAVKEDHNWEKEAHRKRKEALLALSYNYMRYRCGLLEKEVYAKEGLIWRRENQDLLSEEANRLLEIYFMLLDGQTVLAEELLWDVCPENDIQKACVAYFEYLCLTEATEKRKRLLLIQKLYQEKPENRKLLWFLLQIDEQLLNHPKIRLEQMEEYNKEYGPSTLFHAEVLEILNREPFLLKELNTSYVSSLNWGIRMNMLSKSLTDRYMLLASSEDVVCKQAIWGLKELYRSERSDEALTAVLSVMVKNHCIGSHYFHWYEKGILKGLKVINLYEAYLSSAEDGGGLILPKPVLDYFIRERIVPERAKELLYAYILRNKEELFEIYKEYASLIARFAFEQLKKGRLNRNMAVIYQEILQKDKLKEEDIRSLSKLLYRHRLFCDNKNITGVYVSHKELSTEEYFPLTEGVAEIYLFTENPKLKFEDESGCRYGSSIVYHTESYLDLSDWEKECYLAAPENERLLLHLYEKLEKYQMFDENANEIRRRVLEISNLNKEYKNECMLVLIHQYFDKLEEERLKELLLEFIPELVPERERGRLIDYCILQELDKRAYTLLSLWGHQDVPLNRLLRLCDRLLEEIQLKDELLLHTLSYLLQHKRTTRRTLTYLSRYYEGRLEGMAKVWERAKETDIPTECLEERILEQLLFTAGYLPEHIKVFASYYSKGGERVLNRAYLNFYAYQYFIKGIYPKEEFFTLMERELSREYGKILALAYLREKIDKKELLPRERLEVENHLYRFLNKDEIFPFFRGFQDRLMLEKGIFNKTFIEYRSLPNLRVSLSYRTEEAKEYKTILMKELGYGIYTAEFFLFSDEELQYYVTEHDKEEVITESYQVRGNGENKELESSTFGLLEAILAARHLQDDKALEELSAEYILEKYQKERLFKIL